LAPGFDGPDDKDLQERLRDPAMTALLVLEIAALRISATTPSASFAPRP
jgi:hypothetical protein